MSPATHRSSFIAHRSSLVTRPRSLPTFSHTCVFKVKGQAQAQARLFLTSLDPVPIWLPTVLASRCPVSSVHRDPLQNPSSTNAPSKFGPPFSGPWERPQRLPYASSGALLVLVLAFRLWQRPTGYLTSNVLLVSGALRPQMRRSSNPAGHPSSPGLALTHLTSILRCGQCGNLIRLCTPLCATPNERPSSTSEPPPPPSQEASWTCQIDIPWSWHLHPWSHGGGDPNAFSSPAHKPSLGIWCCPVPRPVQRKPYPMHLSSVHITRLQKRSLTPTLPSQPPRH